MSESPVLELHRRVRRRRRQLGMTGTDLAVRAGISTSYVSLIETGTRVPDEEVAARLARALDDDEALYRAWARAARFGSHDLALLNELELIARTPAYARLVESGQELPPLRGAGRPPVETATSADLSTRLREVASRISPAPRGWGAVEPAGGPVVAVPILGAGEDPRGLARGALARDRLLLDRRLVGGRESHELFAYEVTADMTRLKGVAGVGDRVVFRFGGEPAPDRIAVIHTGAGIVLTRALVKGQILLVLPGEGGGEYEPIPLDRGSSVGDLVLGTQAVLIRPWPVA